LHILKSRDFCYFTCKIPMWRHTMNAFQEVNVRKHVKNHILREKN
jgi:hypothetical protein